jgi:hypothetical protein
MQSRLLIINCPSEYFIHIPMGTFGLCDYLSNKDIQVKLLNLAVYDKNKMARVLNHYLDIFHPTHVGLIFHWQETAEGFLWVGERLKSCIDRVKVICGGFTAGYFGENLLEKYQFADYVVKGDPERPLELLLRGADLSEIPNLIYKDSARIMSNRISYHIDQETISSISFCDMSYLYDYEMYIDAIEKKLGFPIFLGRGCVFSCRYCGGSIGSFRLHSGSRRPVVRSIGAVIADLKRLKDFTRKIYICYEIDPGHIKALFEAMKKERTLIKTFQLNYGAWQLFNKEFLELYKDLFIFDKEKKPVFELSPEVFDDKSRQKIKHRNVTYPLKDLRKNLDLINNYLSDSVNVSVFFSRYHDTARTYSDMRKEIIGIFRLKHDLFSNNLTNVRICYDHLSTDVASRYWENYVKNGSDLDTLISSARKLKAQEQYSFPANNLCIYIPETLSDEDIFRCELLILILKTLEEHFHELFHILFRCLGELTIDLVERVIAEEYSSRPGNVFTSLDHSELLNHLKQKITHQESLMSRLPFVEDLIGLQLKKVVCRRIPQPIRSLYQTKRPMLNQAFISIHSHDYLDLLNFLKRLGKDGQNDLTQGKTVFIFLVDDILSMPYETYNATLKAFEDGISLDEYYEMMKRRRIFTLSYHKDLLARLFQSNVLY